MALFLTGTVNPAGFEVTAAMAAAFGLVGLVGHSGDRSPLDPWQLTAFVLGSVLMVSTRTLSLPMWIVSVAFVALYAGWNRVRVLLSSRALLAGLAVIGVSALSGLGWVLTAGHLRGGLSGKITPTDHPLLMALKQVKPNLESMLAAFGWTEFRPPLPMVLVLIAGALVVVATCRRLTRRQGILAAGYVAFVLLVPLVMQYRVLVSQGVIAWQVRYFLPLLPALFAVLVWSAGSAGGAASQRVGVAVTSLVAAAYVVSHVLVSQRYANGNTGPLNYLASSRWQPPVPSAALLALNLAAGAGLILLSLSGGEGARSDQRSELVVLGREPETAAPADPVAVPRAPTKLRGRSGSQRTPFTMTTVSHDPGNRRTRSHTTASVASSRTAG